MTLFNHQSLTKFVFYACEELGTFEVLPPEDMEGFCVSDWAVGSGAGRMEGLDWGAALWRVLLFELQLPSLQLSVSVEIGDENAFDEGSRFLLALRSDELDVTSCEVGNVLEVDG